MYVTRQVCNTQPWPFIADVDGCEDCIYNCVARTFTCRTCHCACPAKRHHRRSAYDVVHHHADSRPEHHGDAEYEKPAYTDDGVTGAEGEYYYTTNPAFGEHRGEPQEHKEHLYYKEQSDAQQPYYSAQGTGQDVAVLRQGGGGIKMSRDNTKATNNPSISHILRQPPEEGERRRGRRQVHTHHAAESTRGGATRSLLGAFPRGDDAHGDAPTYGKPESWGRSGPTDYYRLPLALSLQILLHAAEGHPSACAGLHLLPLEQVVML